MILGNWLGVSAGGMWYLKKEDGGSNYLWDMSLHLRAYISRCARCRGACCKHPVSGRYAGVYYVYIVSYEIML